MIDTSAASESYDITEYEYNVPADYGTNLSAVRTVVEKKTADAPVTADGTSAGGTVVTQKVSTYDYYGNLISVSGYGVDAIEYEYDSKNRVVRERHVGDNTEKTYQYTVGNGARSRVTDEAGAVMDVNYDGLGRYKNTTIYTGEGTSSPLVTESVEYDGQGRVADKTVSKGAGAEDSYVLSTRYWSSGKLWKEEIRGGASNTLYRQNQYEYKESYPDSGDHDENCQQIIIRQVNGADSSKWVTSYVFHDPWNNVHKEVSLEGSSEYKTTYEYGPNGDLLSMKNPKDNQGGNGPSVQYEYDYAMRVIKETNAVGDSAQKAYDSVGRVVSETDYEGHTTSYAYNTYGQQESVSRPVEAGKVAETVYGYDLSLIHI